MAAPKKQGLDYFPYDVDIDQDDKLNMILGEFGIKGETIYVKLLAWIYKHHGYYMPWDEATQLKFAARVSYALGGSQVNTINEVVKRCIKWGLFDQAVFESFQILTSTRIQATWLDATRKRKDRQIREDIWIYRVNGGNMPEGTAKKTVKTPQSKVKESKVEEGTLPPTHFMPQGVFPNNFSSANYFSGAGGPPSLQEAQEFFMKSGGDVKQAEKFFNYYEGLGWKKGITPIVYWRSFANQWIADDNNRKEEQSKLNPTDEQRSQAREKLIQQTRNK